MNEYLQKIVIVHCPKCEKESYLYIDVIKTTDFDTTTKVKGNGKRKPNCNCKELEEAFEKAYDETTV